jgi:hypothetical protein
MNPKDVEGVSGHSIRVGATQDLLALNIDLASVMQAGRWKSNRMPMRYGEHVLAARGGMARAGQAPGSRSAMRRGAGASRHRWTGERRPVLRQSESEGNYGQR